MRVVADTNVLVSAYVFPGGTPEQIYRAALEGRIRLGTTAALLAELARVLADKFGWEPGAVESAVGQIGSVGQIVTAPEDVDDITEDAADNRVLEAALAHRADVIVSGDRHLLRLGAWRGIPIVTPGDLAAQLPARSR